MSTFRWVRGELIGRGSYGKVYLDLNVNTGEMMAVKQYLGFEETPSFMSIFLEYVPGGSIASCLRKHGRFDEDVTRSFTSQILSGLAYLHSQGVLHGNLKGENILLETTGTCKISDFAIAQRTDDIDSADAHSSMQGTVFWMAPEVIDAKKGYNAKIDTWSVGCVVSEMWTGQRPWSGMEAMAVLLQVYKTKQGPPIPDDINLSPLAKDFRQKCFATQPDERPPAAGLRLHPYLELPPDWYFTGFN
ncbi:Pkinase-domain-containing protein [Phanerochaete sordida]|uniref:Pkinase-domain-containing protein n=1 Tax=Phanerochaete sordida TaxID=48140 RepID=A0A9P3LF15_9APHY|nr:Pkinase-domain-containing protein [Phanerochaete sordida]